MSDFLIAVHMLVFLEHRQQLVSSTQLADNICVNPIQVRRVATRLVHAGLVECLKGVQGGYRLGQPGGKITLRHVAETCQVQFFRGKWWTGDEDEKCVISSGMGEFATGLRAELNQLILGRLEKKTIAEVERILAANKVDDKPENEP